MGNIKKRSLVCAMVHIMQIDQILLTINNNQSLNRVFVLVNVTFVISLNFVHRWLIWSDLDIQCEMKDMVNIGKYQVTFILCVKLMQQQQYHPMYRPYLYGSIRSKWIAMSTKVPMHFRLQEIYADSNRSTNGKIVINSKYSMWTAICKLHDD